MKTPYGTSCTELSKGRREKKTIFIVTQSDKFFVFLKSYASIELLIEGCNKCEGERLVVSSQLTPLGLL